MSDHNLATRTMMMSWGSRAVYLGPGLQLPPHRNAVAVLAIALKTPMRIAHDARDVGLGFEECASALIEPNRLHLLQTSGDDHAFIYVDALSHDFQSFRKHCRRQHAGFWTGFAYQSAVIDVLTQMPRTKAGWAVAQATLSQALGLTQHTTEQRMSHVIQALERNPNDPADAHEWAQTVGLSSSRFQHLFKQSTGVPFRRFRLWVRMRAALAHALTGASLTEAAHHAGLSSSSHFSTAFKEMFGICPSVLVQAAPIYVEA